MQFQKVPLREKVFASPFEKKILDKYRSFFSIEEIESSIALQWFFGATLFTFFVTFSQWVGNSALTIRDYFYIRHSCWPWFPNCGEYYFLDMLPYGYSQTIFYMVLFGVMLLVAYLMYRREWVLAHVLLLILTIWKFCAMFILSTKLAGNYDYYHIVFSLTLLLLPHKLFFAKLYFVLFYALSATVKFHETWILGSYFTALRTGLPIFPDWSIPVWTNLVIVMQVVGAWFLLSSKTHLQRIALVFFVVFHLYSGVLVEYRYPATVLPTLLILFGVFYRHQEAPLDKKSIAGWMFAVIMIGFQLISVLIPGDERLTLEGNFFGMYMFEANHQCISEATVYFKNGTTLEVNNASALARNRCDPYRYWFQFNERCKRDSSIVKIVWTFDHSINAGPLYRIIDTNNVCELEYQILRHNTWIADGNTAKPIGLPVQNFYR